MSRVAPFVGRGIAFPLRLGQTGGFAMVEGHNEIAESIRLILATAPGERPMRPAFGCSIHDFVFAPANETTAMLIGSEVRRALGQWEPRIDLLAVEVTRDAETDNLLLIDVTYSIKEANDPRNLVFPFYTLPGEGRPTTEANERSAT